MYVLFNILGSWQYCPQANTEFDNERHELREGISNASSPFPWPPCRGFFAFNDISQVVHLGVIFYSLDNHCCKTRERL